MADGILLKVSDEDARAELARLSRAADDMTPAYDAIGGALLQSTRRRFERETDPDGRPWTPLSPRTANRRINRRGDRRGFQHILRNTFRPGDPLLYNSITYEASRNSVEIGSNMPYAAIQQLGGTIRRAGGERTIHLKTIRRKGAAQTRFARAGTKGAVARVVTVKPYTITLPARAYLGLSAGDRTEIGEIVGDHLGGEATP